MRARTITDSQRAASLYLHECAQRKARVAHRVALALLAMPLMMAYVLLRAVWGG